MASPMKYTARSVLEAFYKAESEYTKAPTEERNFDTIAAHLSDDFVMEQTSGLPYAGLWQGAKGMKDWMESVRIYFAGLDINNPEIFEQPGSDRIMVLSTTAYTVRSSGQKVEFPLAQVMTIDLEAGKIKRIQPFYWDVYALNKALSYSPPAGSSN